MYFVCIYTVPSEHRNAAQDRFKKTGGPAPKGVKVIGRWHSVEGRRGVAIFETEDPQSIAKWVQDWSDLISFEIFPALDDSAFAQLLA